MKRVMALIIVFSLIPFALFAYQRSSGKSPTQKSGSYSQIAIFSSDVAPRPYIVIGELSTSSGWSVKRARKLLQRRARKFHADAILDYIEIPGSGGAPIAKGIAVRWAKEGEKGITSIASDMPIPVLVKY